MTLKVNTIAKSSGNNVAMQCSLNLKSYTTTQRNALTSAAGDIIYNTTEQIQDIIGAMVSGNTETNVAVTYDDSDGTLDFVVSADSALIKDSDNDTKIQAEESSDEDKLRYDIAGTEVAVQDGGGLAFTTNSGTVRHHQTQAATYTIAASEGQIMAGPVTVTGTITNNGTLVII